MSKAPFSVRLELESRSENVALVRAALAGVAEATGLPTEATADLATAVSEACNNVVVHAYGGTAGQMVVRIEGQHDGIWLIVTDYGRGIRQITLGENRMGLGLAVISALADRAEFLTPEAGGTEVRMWFARDPGAIDSADANVSEPPAFPGVALEAELVAWVQPVDVLRFVLGRLFTTMASRSHFSVTRVSDLRAVNDAIAEYLAQAGDGGIGLAISKSSRRLSLTGWPVMPPLDSTADTQARSAKLLELEERVHAISGLVGTLQTENLAGVGLLRVELAEAVLRDT